MSSLFLKFATRLAAVALFVQVLPGCLLLPHSADPGISSYSEPVHRTAYASDFPVYAAELEAASAPGLADDDELLLTNQLPPQKLTAENTQPVSLLEMVHQALDRNDIIPVDIQFLSTSNQLLNAPSSTTSRFDPAIQETRVSGERGAIAATTDFIPRLTSRLTFGADDTVQNNLVSAGLPAGSVLKQETADLEVRLEQQLATGGTVQLSQTTSMDQNNVTTNLFRSVFEGQMAVEYSQPLWGGAGKLFTDIAGPVNLISQRNPTLDQGILVTQINDRLSHNQLQIALHQLVKDVADVYQDLYLAHQRYLIEREARDYARSVQDRMEARTDSGHLGAAENAQASEAFFAAESRVQDALAEISLTENRLRRLTGLKAGNGLTLKPLSALEIPHQQQSLESSLQTAFNRRPELNETILRIQRLQLVLIAARSYRKPQVSLVTNFHMNGFGDRLYRSSRQQGISRRESYWNDLLSGDRVGWFAGVQAEFDLDRRRARTLQQNQELELAKHRNALKAQKKEISHEVWHAFRSADRWAEQMELSQQRVDAAEEQVDSLDAAFPTSKGSVDLLVRAQTTLAQARIELARATSEYNKSIGDIHFRQGTLLDELNISVQGMPPI